MSKSVLQILSSLLLSIAIAATASAEVRRPHHSIPLRFLGGQAPRTDDAQHQARPKSPAKPHHTQPVRNGSGLIVYDEPEATGGTWGYGIDAGGYAVGEFIGSDNHTHGFLRAPDNTFTKINVSTFPTSAFWINDLGAIIGNYLADGIQHAYILTPKGKFLTFEPEDTQGTFGLDINNKGIATGDYVDSGGVWHGFIRARDGTLTVFDESNAGTDVDQGTFAGATNTHGDTTGPYVDANNVLHGYIRHRDGTFTDFDMPGAFDTIPFLINVKGWVVGLFDTETGEMHGFIRKKNGKIITVDAPDAGNGPGQGTIVAAISEDGVATGNYVDSNDVLHGFIRSKKGKIKEFDAPGAGPGGTTPVDINRDGAISGYEYDENDLAHGVIGIP